MRRAVADSMPAGPAILSMCSDVVIWHLRGRESVVRKVIDLARKGRLMLSAITRAEVITGLREQEHKKTLTFLDACETIPVDQTVADLAGNLVREYWARGITIHFPDALIGATALARGIVLYTCNPRHYPYDGLEVVEVVP